MIETKTLRDHLVLFLVNKGLWPKEANTIIDIVIADKLNEAVKFSSLIGDYPQALVALLKMTTAKTAIIWMEKHEPFHFAKTILEDICS